MKIARNFPQDTLDQARVISNGWAKIDPELTFAGLTQSGLQELIDRVISIENQIIGMDAELVNLRNERDEAYEQIWDQAKRARMATQPHRML